jgi:hypothetical protein
MSKSRPERPQQVLVPPRTWGRVAVIPVPRPAARKFNPSRKATVLAPVVTASVATGPVLRARDPHEMDASRLVLVEGDRIVWEGRGGLVPRQAIALATVPELRLASPADTSAAATFVESLLSRTNRATSDTDRHGRMRT